MDGIAYSNMIDDVKMPCIKEKYISKLEDFIVNVAQKPTLLPTRNTREQIKPAPLVANNYVHNKWCYSCASCKT